MSKAKITLFSVFKKGANKYTIILSNGDVFVNDSKPNSDINECVGNVTDRLNITWGYGWRNHVKSLKSALKGELEYYLANPPEMVGKKVKIESLPKGVVKHIDCLLSVATKFK